jgi:hypothetical protein
MFAVVAFFAIGVLAWVADRANMQDRKAISQDLKFIAFLLAAILMMLGVIADRVH